VPFPLTPRDPATPKNPAVLAVQPGSDAPSMMKPTSPPTRRSICIRWSAQSATSARSPCRPAVRCGRCRLWLYEGLPGHALVAARQPDPPHLTHW